MFRGLLLVPIQISDSASDSASDSELVVLLLGKLCFTQREGPTQLLLQQKSRMTLAGLVYLNETFGSGLITCMEKTEIHVLNRILNIPFVTVHI